MVGSSLETEELRASNLSLFAITFDIELLHKAFRKALLAWVFKLKFLTELFYRQKLAFSFKQFFGLILFLQIFLCCNFFLKHLNELL